MLTQAITAAGGFSQFTAPRIRLFRSPGGFDDLAGTYKVVHAEIKDPSGWDDLNPAPGKPRGERKDCISVDVRRIEAKKEPDVLLKPGDWIATRKNED